MNSSKQCPKAIENWFCWLTRLPIANPSAIPMVNLIFIQSTNLGAPLWVNRDCHHHQPALYSHHQATSRILKQKHHQAKASSTMMNIEELYQRCCATFFSPVNESNRWTMAGDSQDSGAAAYATLPSLGARKGGRDLGISGRQKPWWDIKFPSLRPWLRKFLEIPGVPLLWPPPVQQHNCSCLLLAFRPRPPRKRKAWKKNNKQIQKRRT